MYLFWFYFFKQKTGYELRIGDWSSDVGSSDLRPVRAASGATEAGHASAEDDALQLKPFGQRPARLIEPLADAQPPPALVDCHFNSIEPVAGRVVAAADAVAADGLPVMRAKRHLLVYSLGGAIAAELALHHATQTAI